MFVFQNSESWEAKSLLFYCVCNKIKYRIDPEATTIKRDEVPSGTVDWTLRLLGRNVEPNYFPRFLYDFVERRVWKSELMPNEKCFIKPADRYKRFDACLSSELKDQAGPFVCSEIVSFIDEFRYYIASGECLDAQWYLGENDDPKDPPKLNIKWPKKWCGAADFGLLKDGSIQLVEAHHPFACGWYGKKQKIYAEFVQTGWKYLKERKDEQFAGLI